MPPAGGKQKLKYDFVLDFTKYDISWLKFDFEKKAQDKLKSDREISKIVKTIKFKVEFEGEESEWPEDRVIEDGYCQFRGLVKVLSERIMEGQKIDEVKKAYDKVNSQAEKVVLAWIKKEASGGADNERSLRAGAKALEGVAGIDPEAISKKPRTEAIAALEPMLKSGADEKAKEKAADALKTAHDEFKKAGGGVNEAIKAILAAGKKIASANKGDASLKAFGAKITKDKGIFKTMTSELDALDACLEEVCKVASDGKLDEKSAKTYSEMLKKLKSLDGSVDKGFSALDKYADQFEDISEKLSK